ncbi:hypothetical protein GCM10009554_50740 [Kribbella koreensis]|uniref:Uncharacterized protein n=1 Tax=Kribbella koreensis TaxID=57909 RepID=A0ABN1R2F7_9ACTN
MVDNEDLPIRCLITYPGYTGKLNGSIHAGMTFDDLLRRSPPIRRKALHMFQGFLYVDLEESTAFLLPHTSTTWTTSWTSQPTSPSTPST